MKKIPVRRLCECALLIALQIILSRMASLLDVSTKLGFSFLPMALCGMLYGPKWGAACYAIADLIGAILLPQGPYFPGFTLSCAIMGFCYGHFLYRREKLRLFPDILVPAVFNTVVIGLVLNTLWVAILYTSRGYIGWLVVRIPQEVILLVLHIVLLPVLGKLVEALRKAGLK